MAGVEYDGQFTVVGLCDAVDPTHEAFEFGVNYLVFGVTHQTARAGRSE